MLTRPFCGLLVASVLFICRPLYAACEWPAWTQFKQDYIRADGRVVDPSDARKITTSEGQSYALFFALVADDRDTFNQVLGWTQNNLSAGALTRHLPAWLWGKKDDGSWGVLDSNAASDADLWIAWALLEAGRLWQQPRFSAMGSALLRRIADDEVAWLPGFGFLLLPGNDGFTSDNRWRLNPSYLPPQVIQRFARYGEPWRSMSASMVPFLQGSSPAGIAPDWVDWVVDKGWQPAGEPKENSEYNAIRVYLWVGMMSDEDPRKKKLLAHFSPVADIMKQRALPPESINSRTGKPSGNGPVGFSAALLPFLSGHAQEAQRQRTASAFPGADAYYSYVLTLFGQGWDQHRFRFTSQGELSPVWGRLCATSH
ncbi:cellulose synthase complex periplasmic endoglucanase BcsZ [Mangrovibacter plantisponsor]|uniref:Glucanase n=1 Tax=Mangrovibacter plantisponsor TaxID=451513 RepID=A0A317PXC4_9ENTR|nr:cellulose synthase complex periplasmic endoglucanase BcsZ [Mangrovibacter plantisponsor]PWW06601.1 cellulase (glycosyl hydrolase family 8) [Mangrovibacter plantisponsor]